MHAHAWYIITMSHLSVLFDLVGDIARRRFQIGERCFATLGLNHTEARLLTLLDQKNGESTQDTLSNMLSIDRSNAGRGLKSLEQNGYVIRSKDSADGRTRLIHLTANGRKVVTEIVKLRKQMAETFFGELTEEQAGTIADLLGKAMKFEKS